MEAISNTASKYDDVQHVFYERIHKALQEVVSLTSWNFEKGKVLDYGCGTGRTGFEFLLPYIEITDSNLYSVDISQTMVDYAKANFPHPRIQYALGSLPDNFSFENEKFDKVVCVGVLHFCPDIRNVLQGISNTMKAGAELVFTCVTVGACAIKIWQELAQTEEWGKYMKNYKKFYPEWTNYRSLDPLSYFRTVLLSGTGFEEVSIKFIKYQISTTNVDAAIECSTLINPCLEDIPEHLHEELRRDYRKIFKNLPGVVINEGSFECPVELLYGVIRKT